MDEVVLDGKTYVASRKAASECGYAQDYVGQLSRKGFIDAKRVSGQWYVQLESLKAYKEKAEAYKPEPPKYQPDPNVEASINVDGKEYVSAARAAKLADYNQDYIAQLARAGKVPSRQMGNRWYIEPTALLLHRQEKDAMLRAVQAEAVGLKRPELRIVSSPVSFSKQRIDLPIMSYAKEDRPLFPEIAESVALKAVPNTESEEIPAIGPTSKIAIKVLRPITIEAREDIQVPAPVRVYTNPKPTILLPEKTMSSAISWRYAFAVVLLVAVGLGTYQKDKIYAFVTERMGGTQTASVGSIGGNISSVIERVLSKELIYKRK